MSRRFDSVLVANRGEIAMRVLRSARDMGYRTVAVYSSADADSPHVSFADEAVEIGPAAVSESYLDAARILAAMLRTGAQAIHPGYGFLSENAAFAEACAEADLVFIGPSAEAISLMGNKAQAKRLMLEAGVPCIPGYQDTDQSDAALQEAAQRIGVPLMVKAAAGGGGRGMRLVQALEDLPRALADARSEALNAFGSDELILEKAVLQPRHVEIQVFGDEHGAVVHLGERDCSVQRRHQKVVEESPCPVMTPELRAAMGDAAVAAAKSINYVGAGTVEFLLDADSNFYFLEMNTRLQVEHPVTEMVTGIDLVRLQFDIAQGKPLPVSQNAISLSGHAIEVRLYAEDAENGFLPVSGTAEQWEPPAGEGIRVDHGLRSGQLVSPFYDPMIAKIIAWGEDRDTACRRLERALEHTQLFGLRSNRQFLVDVLRRPAFAEGRATTAFIAEEFGDSASTTPPRTEAFALAALLQFLEAQATTEAARVDSQHAGKAGSSLAVPYAFETGESVLQLQVVADQGGAFYVRMDEREFLIEIVDAIDESRLRIAIDGAQSDVAFCFPAAGGVELLWQGEQLAVRNLLDDVSSGDSAQSSGAVRAPMHGNLLQLAVAVGQRVEVGDELAVMEAMKMEHRLNAPISGVVDAIHANKGDQVAAGAMVMEIRNEDP
ncbi:MAG: geranyl-CoA carboxylase subunit apha [Congregibacter sp.]